MCVAFIVIAVCSFIYKKPLQNNTPICYDGDSLSILTIVKCYADGDFNPISPRIVPRLNAPSRATWGDFPIEKLVFYPAGILARILGLCNGVTVYLILSMALAGCSFYCVGQLLGYRKDLLVATGILFGLAPYAFARNINHLTLSLYWNIPLLIFVIIWCGWREKTTSSYTKTLFAAMIIGFISGFLNPYYLIPFMVMLGMLLPGILVEKSWIKVKDVLLIVLSCFAGFFINNLDVLINLVQNGVNHSAVNRDLWGLVIWGFYLPDLFFPRSHHIEALQRFSHLIYHSKVPLQISGESQSGYIGIISLIGFILMMFIGVAYIVAKKFSEISPLFWICLGYISFGIVGGINYMLGVLGFQLLRSSNRISIVISCLSLYFLCELFRNIPKRITLYFTLFLILLFGIYDQTPDWDDASARRNYLKDKKDFSFLEKSLPNHGQIFELPVKYFPESPIFYTMGDYEHLRPFIHTTELKFSYGFIQGRGDSNWQFAIDKMSPNVMISELKKRGFCALLINKKGYQDKGIKLTAAFVQNLGSPLLSTEDIDVFVLN